MVVAAMLTLVALVLVVVFVVVIIIVNLCVGLGGVVGVWSDIVWLHQQKIHLLFPS